MPRYNIKTFVDITRSNPDRDNDDPIAKGQQSNFDSLVQGIGLRANVSWVSDPTQEIEDEKKYWIWNFDVEQEDVFTLGDNPVGLLEQDLHLVPIIKNLTNEVSVKPMFLTKGNDTNIWVSLV
jgi:hypothetical protein